MKEIITMAKRVDPFGYAVIEDGKREFLVPDLMVGEEAKVELFQSGHGKVLSLLKESPDRIKPKCPWYHECGGCQLQQYSQEDQAKLKENALRYFLTKVEVEEEKILPIIAAKQVWNYRNKNQMVISPKGKRVMSGFYEENTHKIINVDECVVQDERANKIIKTCRKIMEDQRIPAYEEDKKTGLIRHLLVRIAENTGEILLVVVTSQEMFPGRANFVKEVRRIHPEITSIVQNINPRTTSVVLGDFERILFGTGAIRDTLLNKSFLISPRTFYQIHSKQTEILYKKAMEVAKPKKTDVFLDAYSGVGTIGILFAEHVKRVIAVESNKDSVKNAILNAKLNKINNIRFHHAQTLDLMDQLIAENTQIDLFLVDPPRSGLETGLVEKIGFLRPRRFVYVSCHPETLARDIVALKLVGYVLSHSQPIDMFPQTNHVESVTLLELK